MNRSPWKHAIEKSLNLCWRVEIKIRFLCFALKVSSEIPVVTTVLVVSVESCSVSIVIVKPFSLSTFSACSSRRCRTISPCWIRPVEEILSFVENYLSLGPTRHDWFNLTQEKDCWSNERSAHFFVPKRITHSDIGPKVKFSKKYEDNSDLRKLTGNFRFS